jgi:hypothetical protein
MSGCPGCRGASAFSWLSRSFLVLPPCTAREPPRLLLSWRRPVGDLRCMKRVLVAIDRGLLKRLSDRPPHPSPDSLPSPSLRGRSFFPTSMASARPTPSGAVLLQCHPPGHDDQGGPVSPQVRALTVVDGTLVTILEGRSRQGGPARERLAVACRGSAGHATSPAARAHCFLPPPGRRVRTQPFFALRCLSAPPATRLIASGMKRSEKPPTKHQKSSLPMLWKPSACSSRT